MKTEITAALLTFAATLGWRAEAQPRPTHRTENIVAVEDFRRVNGQLYNIRRSVLWTNYQADVVIASTNLLVVQTFTMEPIYEAATRSIETRNYLGHVTSSRIVPTTVEVGTKKVPGMKYMVRNYSPTLNPAAGRTISFRAMKVGTATHGGNTYELLDHGTPNDVPVVTTNRTVSR